MSSLPEKIEVICPKCGEEFGGWLRPSADPAVSSTCPTCGFALVSDDAVWSDGAYQPVLDELEVQER